MPDANDWHTVESKEKTECVNFDIKHIFKYMSGQHDSLGTYQGNE